MFTGSSGVDQSGEVHFLAVVPTFQIGKCIAYRTLISGMQLRYYGMIYKLTMGV